MALGDYCGYVTEIEIKAQTIKHCCNRARQFLPSVPHRYFFWPPIVIFFKKEILYFNQQTQILQASAHGRQASLPSPLTPSLSPSEGNGKGEARGAAARAGCLQRVLSPGQPWEDGSCHRPFPINEVPAASAVGQACLQKEGPRTMSLTSSQGVD